MGIKNRFSYVVQLQAARYLAISHPVFVAKSATKPVCLMTAVSERLPSAFRWLSPRSISIRQLHASPHVHPEPIYLVFFKGSYLLA
jgi:hypothetical protein